MSKSLWLSCRPRHSRQLLDCKTRILLLIDSGFPATGRVVPTFEDLHSAARMPAAPLLGENTAHCPPRRAFLPKNCSHPDEHRRELCAHCHGVAAMSQTFEGDARTVVNWHRHLHSVVLYTTDKTLLQLKPANQCLWVCEMVYCAVAIKRWPTSLS